MPDGTGPSEFAVKLGASAAGAFVTVIRAVFQADEIGSNVSMLDAFPHGFGVLMRQPPATVAGPRRAERRSELGATIAWRRWECKPGWLQESLTLQPLGQRQKEFGASRRPARVERAGASESNYANRPTAQRGGDDVADALRYLVATKARTIVERKLREL